MRTEAAQVAVEELLRLNVDVIVVSSTLTALIAKKATTKVPIVVTVPADPVATGLVTSLARPGGNVTGLSFVGTELAGKQVELLNEAVPGLRRVAVLANPGNASHAPRTKEILEVARTLKLQSDVVDAATPEAFDSGRIYRDGSGAASEAPPSYCPIRSSFEKAQNLSADRRRAAAARHVRTAKIVAAGGLMSYRRQFQRLVPARGRMRGQDPQKKGGVAERSAGGASVEVRASVINASPPRRRSA